MTALLIKLITYVFVGVGSVLWRNYRQNKLNNMSLYSDLSATSQGTALDRICRWALKWLDDNPASMDTPLEVALDYGQYLQMVESDFSGVNWETKTAWGGPIPPRPPAV